MTTLTPDLFLRRLATKLDLGDALDPSVQLYTHDDLVRILGSVQLPFTRANFIALIESAEGTPYLFGGIDPFNGGADCSGLVYWAGLQCGVTLPRTTEAEWDDLAVGTTTPGDLVEFEVPGDGGSPPQHVGIYISAGTMIDDPETGEVVSVQQIPSVPGVIWPIGYRTLPFVNTPPPPPPPPEEMMPCSPVVTYRNNQQDVFQCFDNALWHKWKIGKTWDNENVGYVAGVGTTNFPNQVPQVAIMDGQVLVTIEDSAGQVFYFAQGQSGPWGVNALN